MAGTLPGFDRVCRPGASRHGRSLRLQAHAGKASTIQELQADLRAKRRSAVEITTKYIEQIHQTNDKIKSFITVDAEKALQQVRRASAVWRCSWA